MERYVRMYLIEIGWEGVDWGHLAHYKYQWRARVNTVMNLSKVVPVLFLN